MKIKIPSVTDATLAKHKKEVDPYHVVNSDSTMRVTVYRHQDDERHLVVIADTGQIVKRYPNGELSRNKAQHLAHDLDYQLRNAEWKAGKNLDDWRA